MYSRMCPCGIRITCRNQVKRQIQHRPLNQKTYLGTGFQCLDIHFTIFFNVIFITIWNILISVVNKILLKVKICKNQAK
jgi:hypothetical protein